MSNLLIRVVALFTLAGAGCNSAMAPQGGSPPQAVRNVVLVHGGFVDGSGWQAVYQDLTNDGYNVSIVQNPTTSLADDAAATKRVLAAQDGPTILVGHSYGGAVITEAGTDATVVGLVYLCAFAPDAGESVQSLIQQFPTDGPMPPIVGPQDGFLLLDKAKFHDSFAQDLSDARATFLANAQVPWGVNAFGGVVSQAAWRSKPSWYLVTKDDRMIPPAAQRTMAGRTGATVSEINGSHAIYESKARDVVNLIEEAAHAAH
jgi:pimeloyl-ACP methyl ester carboxylesterase